MALTNYTELQAAIGTWLHRADTATIAPDLIALAEGELRLDPSIYKLNTERFATVADTSEYNLTSVLPSAPTAIDAIQGASVVTAFEGGPLDVTTVAELNRRQAISGETSGVPRALAYLTRDLVRLWPTPDSSDYSIDVAYRQQLPGLSDSVPTNWLLTEHPHIYLYASLVQSESFIVNDERLPMWSQRLEVAMQKLLAKREREQFPSVRFTGTRKIGVIT